MNSSRSLLLLIVASFLGSSAFAQSAEVERLQGFAKQQNEGNQFDKARQQGERAYLEEEEQWENQKDRALQEYKKNKSHAGMTEDSPEARADAAAKKEYADVYEKERRSYVALSKKQAEIDRKALKLPSEPQELGLLEERPRYDYRKRAMYGAPLKFGKNASSSSSGSGSGYSGGFGGGSGSSFPPPPTFDDGGGYVPAPNNADDFGDIPPPPPPPPVFGDGVNGMDDFGGSNFGGDSDFPPPPPPPIFEGGSDF